MSMIATGCVVACGGLIGAGKPREANRSFHDGRPHSIDIKLFVRDGRIILRLRDDCKAFDATRRSEILHPEDNLANVGIRILNSIATDINYYSILDMNYLIMHV